ncbi:MAG: DUF1343 domain-containing protein [Bacteroidales bacterium]|nr:DUF1343 domain-containing protein [Bacteroidales bacterium]
MKRFNLIITLVCLISLFFCAFCLKTNTKEKEEKNVEDMELASVKVGAERMPVYLPFLQGKNVAVVGNQTSMVVNTHLVDTLLKSGISVKKIFTPEHGFRGVEDAGAAVNDGIDKVTGLPLISLYGKHKKPTVEDLQGIDVVVFDIQDVGVRFYTYISTMHYVMEACAENNVSFWVLDRPNPTEFIDGPVLKQEYSSFVGMHPVPIAHGMTIAEYAQMVNGEKWLKNGVQCDLHVVTCDGYEHGTYYAIPIPPSPNLPNMTAICCYPTLCLFEGTRISVGRGTEFPFQVYGHPQFKEKDFSFVPESRKGASNPLYKGETCYGKNLRGGGFDCGRLNISVWLDAYKNYGGSEPFFNSFFTKLAGTTELQKAIESGLSEEEIRKSWEDDLNAFRQIRQKYLLYTDF